VFFRENLRSNMDQFLLVTIVSVRYGSRLISDRVVVRKVYGSWIALFRSDLSTPLKPGNIAVADYRPISRFLLPVLKHPRSCYPIQSLPFPDSFGNAGHRFIEN